MSCVRRLGSDPEPLLKSALPSPGETRKLMLCLGLLEEPWLVIMDEPTNHLDLPGIECLEEALSDLDCALLLVSHDRMFLANTTSCEWRVETDGEGGVLRIF
jgi:ATPase subunit of ABC transporter with duplicated ATPase domains